MAEHGRIRLGVKTQRAMKSIDTFRFTSPDKTAIETIASLYGGQVKAWSEPKASLGANQWEVITTSNEIRVFLPPDALSIWYEEWTGGGCTRRCDGITCQVPQRTGPDGGDLVDVPCLCVQQGAMKCKPYTRMNLILPEVRFGGAWRLETKGWNAAHEMPGMEAMIQQLQAVGIVEARLVLEKRQSEGGSKKFVVPKLIIDTTPMRMLAGAANVGALTEAAEASERPALAAGPSTDQIPGTPTPPGVSSQTESPVERAWFEDPDTEIVDAEIVTEDDYVPPPAEESSSAIERVQAKGAGQSKAQTKLVLTIAEVFVRLKNETTVELTTEDELRHAIVWSITKGRTTSSKELTDEERSKALDALGRFLSGELAPTFLAQAVTNYSGRPM